MLHPLPHAAQTAADNRPPRPGWSELVAWAALLSAVVFLVPLFVCMPLTPDTLLYDLSARTVLRGGVMYRDVFDNNLPGAVWIHCGLLGLLGNRSEAIRLFDLAVLALIVVLLVRLLALMRRPRVVLVWTAVLLWLFYSSLSEWCHCQRDTWMLLPALGALHLRLRHLGQLGRREVPAWRLLLGTAAEGLLWGTAVWIKPFVLVPAAAVWLVGAATTRGVPAGPRRRLADFTGLLAGGLLAGGAGLAWLYASGAWSAFWDIMLHWNDGYYAQQSSDQRWSQALSGVRRLFPWSVVHLPALFLAAAMLLRALRARGAAAASPASLARALLAALYLGWEAQAVLLQHRFDYIHAPGVLLAVALVAAQPLPPRAVRVGWVVTALFLLIAAFRHPQLQPDHAAVWARCWREGGSPDVRDRLSAWPFRSGGANWVALAQAADYLRTRAGPGQLTCYHQPAIGIYKEAELTPATRYAYVDVVVFWMPRHRNEILSDLGRSGQRFVLTSVDDARLPPAEIELLPPDGPQPAPYEGLSSRHGNYPWSLPVVFRAGPYLVHQVPDRRNGGG
jgi:hypothetical protein